MKGLLRKFEDAMAAVAFAEAGEFETAREIITEKQSAPHELQYLKCGAAEAISSLTAMAITFAEAGEHEAAIEILQEAEDMLDEMKEKYRRIIITPVMSAT